MTEVHTIEGTEDLLMQTIKDQASSLEHGWREAVQNGIDSPGSSLVRLDFSPSRTVVRDDGEGVDLSSEEGLALLKNLGESTKGRSDDSTIGQFGVGKGQVIAKGHTTFMSGDRALHFDVEEWGLECKEVPLAREVDGLVVVVSHYADEVPDPDDSRWSRYEDRVSRRFRYVEHALGTRVEVNGERVSGNDPRDAVSEGDHGHVETSESEHGDIDIAVQVARYSGVDVYSNGVRVTREYDMGVGGVVVSHANMDVDFGRDGIKDGCPVWGAARDRLNEVRMALFEDADPELMGDDARAFIARRAMTSEEGRERFADKAVFGTASETLVSLSDVESRGEVGYDESGAVAADRLSEAGHLVLDEDDGAVEELREAAEAGEVEAPEAFDPEEKAEELGLMTIGERVDRTELNTVQEKKLLAAKELTDRLGIRRRVYYGESDAFNAWTDGETAVVITDGAAPSRNRAAWVWELAETLVHEWCHDEDTMDGCSHGRDFDRLYRRRWSGAVGVVSEFITEVEREGLADVVEGVQVVRPDMAEHIEWKN